MQSLSADLLRAIQAGDITAVDAAISAGADPDVLTENGIWALDLAVSTRAYQIMNVLIAAGADVNRVHRGETLLKKAIGAGDLCLVAHLLEHGASPHGITAVWETPLVAAAQRANLEILELLIKAGVDVNAVDRFDESALSRCFHLPNAVAALQLTGAEPRDVEVHLLAPLRFPEELCRPRVKQLIRDLERLCNSRIVHNQIGPGTVAFVIPEEFACRPATARMQWLSESGQYAERIAQEFIDDVWHHAAGAGCLVFSAGTGDSSGICINLLPTTDKFAAMATMRISDPFDGPGTYGLIRGFKFWDAEFPFQLRGCEMRSLIIYNESDTPFPKAAPERLNQIFRDICQPGQLCPNIAWQQSGPFARISWDWQNSA